MKLPLFVEVLDFPNRPARAVVLQFYDDVVGVDVVNRNSGRELLSGGVKYIDGSKTKDTLTNDIVRRAESNIIQAVSVCDSARGKLLRDYCMPLNFITIVKDSVEDVKQYLMRKLGINDLPYLFDNLE